MFSKCWGDEAVNKTKYGKHNNAFVIAQQQGQVCLNTAFFIENDNWRREK